MKKLPIILTFIFLLLPVGYANTMRDIDQGSPADYAIEEETENEEERRGPGRRLRRSWEQGQEEEQALDGPGISRGSRYGTYPTIQREDYRRGQDRIQEKDKSRD
jgi:hypothetical protein